MTFVPLSHDAALTDGRRPQEQTLRPPPFISPSDAVAQAAGIPSIKGFLDTHSIRAELEKQPGSGGPQVVQVLVDLNSIAHTDLVGTLSYALGGRDRSAAHRVLATIEALMFGLQKEFAKIELTVLIEVPMSFARVTTSVTLVHQGAREPRCPYSKAPPHR